MLDAVWEVVGGGDKGGIIVRTGVDLTSSQASERLSTGALVRQEELVGERLRFSRLTGSGPDTGWVSLRLKGKELLAPSRERLDAAQPRRGWGSSFRLYAISDLHVDFKENKTWVQNLPELGHKHDAVVLAGDISHSAEEVLWTLAQFVRRFRYVFYCIGNHELWIVRKDAKGHNDKVFADSVEKFDYLMAAARDVGAVTEPIRLGEGDKSIWVVPLQAWYQSEFGKPGEKLKEEAKMMFTDYHQVVWPTKVGTTSDDVAEFFDRMNDALPASFDAPVITFSHFLPRLELMPAQLPPYLKMLRAGVGTKTLEDRLRAIGSKIHIFGHSHVNWYTHWNGVHYVQNALRYPYERKGFKSRVDVSFDGIEDPLAPFIIWNSDDPENFCLQPERCGRGCPRASAHSEFINNKDSKTAAKTWAESHPEVERAAPATPAR